MFPQEKRRSLLLVVALVLSSAHGLAPPNAPPRFPRQRATRTASWFIPPCRPSSRGRPRSGYCSRSRRTPRTRCPVVYVLPVEAGNAHHYGDGLLEIQKRDLHRRFSAIFVAPTFAQLPWYADHPSDPEIRQESYFLKVVVPFIEQRYPARADRDGRLLVGFSKSGWGAYSLLLRHPDHFGKAAAWDAPLMEPRPARFGMGPIFGTQENFEQYQITTLARSPGPRPARDGPADPAGLRQLPRPARTGPLPDGRPEGPACLP